MGSAWSGRSVEADGAPGGWSSRERAVSAQGSPGPTAAASAPGWWEPWTWGVFPVLGSDSPGREGSAGLSSGVAEGEGMGGRGP